MMEEVSDLLGAVVSDFDTDIRLICREGCAESFVLTWGKLVARGAREKLDFVEGIASASAVTQGFLLDAATYLTWSVTGELDDVKGIKRAGGTLELVINGLLAVRKGSSVAIRTPAQKSYPRSASQFSCTVPDLPGTKSNKRAGG